MSRLHLKETRADREDKEWRKLRRAARKAARYADLDAPGPSNPKSQPYSFVFEHGDEGWVPPELSHKQTEHELEEQPMTAEAKFRARLFDEMDSDSTHAWFNTYVPPRWRESDTTTTPPSGLASGLGDEEYAEYIRKGMWERTHKAEHDEKLKRKAEADERKHARKKAREATKRLEEEEIAKRRIRKQERDRRQFVDAWKTYEDRWTALQKDTLIPESLGFESLPWPVYPPPTGPQDLAKDRIASFLLSESHSSGRTKKQRLRDAYLLFHPDKFVGKIMPAIRPEDRDIVQEAIGAVARVLNSLSEE